jgi:hypothetical protein
MLICHKLNENQSFQMKFKCVTQFTGHIWSSRLQQRENMHILTVLSELVNMLMKLQIYCRWWIYLTSRVTINFSRCILLYGVILITHTHTHTHTQLYEINTIMQEHTFINIQLSVLVWLAVWEWHCKSTFWRLSVPPSSGMVTETERVSEMLAYNTILAKITPEDFIVFS